MSIERQIVESLEANKPVVLCKLVETRGSTPQKAGAQMLVFADGTQAGTLGGGCVEADVKRQALRAMGEGRSFQADFLLDDNYGWDDGLICGGKIRVLVDPLTPARDAALFSALVERMEEKRNSLLVSVFEGEATGAKVVVDNGELIASAGEWPQDRLRESGPSKPGLTWFADGVFYQIYEPPMKLVIIGAGHVGQALAKLAARLEFEVHVIDDRETYASAERFPDATKLIAGEIGASIDAVDADDRTFFVIVTRGHSHDEEALYHAVRRPAAYVGMIGSKRKVKLIFDDLRSMGIPESSLAHVHAPVGLDIGSQSVEEIAISIAAELVQVRSRRRMGVGTSGGSLSGCT